MGVKVSTQYLILADFGRCLFLPPPEQLLFPDNLYGLPPMSLAELETHIRSIPDFPKPGILFRDITPLLHNRFRDTIEEEEEAILKAWMREHMAGHPGSIWP